MELKSDMLVKDFLTFWLTFVVKNTMSKATASTYQYKITKHVMPNFGDNLRLSTMNNIDIQNIVCKLGESGLSDSSIRSIYDAFHKALGYAASIGIINQSTLSNIVVPKPSPYQAYICTPIEINKIMDVAVGTMLEIPIAIGCMTGMRRSEILGLMWSDYNESTNLIAVYKSLSNPKTNEFSNGKSSYRAVPVTKPLAELLNSWKERQEKILMKKGINHGKYTFICTNNMGKAYEPSYFSNLFKKFLKENNLPNIRFHDLRHSYINNAIHDSNGNKSIKEISIEVGHSSATLTLDYYTRYQCS